MKLKKLNKWTPIHDYDNSKMDYIISMILGPAVLIVLICLFFYVLMQILIGG